MKAVLSKTICFIALTTCVWLRSADHLDSSIITDDVPGADITDIYAWMSFDASAINFILNVDSDAASTATFSDSLVYVIHVNSSTTYSSAQTETVIQCEFDSSQRISCFVGDDLKVSEKDAGSTSGVVSDDNTFRVFAGLRDDPFFFDLGNFTAVADAVIAASPTVNAAGCPSLTTTVQTSLANRLTGQDSSNPPTNDFAGQNVLSIVIQASKSLFGSGPIYGIWMATHRKG